MTKRHEVNSKSGVLANSAAALVLLVAALLIGGASRESPFAFMVVELLGLAALLIALLRLPRFECSSKVVIALVILGLLFAIPILQLTPLAPSVWKPLPGREPLAHAVALSGLPDRWRPMSLAPDQTSGAILFLLAPAGMFLTALQCDWRQRGWMVTAVIGVALLSLLVGGVQVAGGEARTLQFYSAATAGLPNGFFANRNHQASFMAALIALAAALPAIEGLPALINQRRSVIILVLMLLFAVGAAATLSRAGILLSGFVLLGGLWILRPNLGRLDRKALLILLAVGLAVLLVIAMVLTLKGGAIFDRFETGNAGGGRIGMLPDIIRLGKTFQPFGGGVGSFDLSYRATEQLAQIQPAFLNHAHNDYIEIWLEAGWPGVLLIAGFLLWWGFTAIPRWTNLTGAGSALARAGSLVTAVFIFHSTADYPLRTPALAVLFAFGCALMLDPLRAKPVIHSDRS